MTEMRASLTVTADASSVVLEARRASEALRELRRETSAAISSSRPATLPIDPSATLRRELAEQTTRANRALEASISPIVAAERELAREQQALNRAMAAGAAAGSGTGRALDGLAAGADRAADGGRRAAASLRDVRSAADEAARSAEAAQQRMASQLDTAFNGFGANRRPASDSAAVFEGDHQFREFEAEQAAAAARSFRMLEESINPVIRAEREMAEAQAIVNRALQTGQATNLQAASALAELERRYEGLVRAQSPAAQSAMAFERALEEEERSVRQLMLALDPAARAVAEFERAQHQLSRAVTAGVISQEEAARSLRLLEAQQQAVGRSGASMGMGIQNVSFQMTDFVVQVQSGQSASVALAQQLPQLLGGFGTLGAVLGLVVALGVPLVSMLLGSADAAGSLDDRLQRLDASLDRMTQRLDILRDARAAETFGTMTATVRQLSKDLLDLDRASELKVLRETLNALTKQNIKPGVLQSAWEGLKAGYNTGLIYTPGQIAALQDRVSRENYSELTGGRGPGYDEFQTKITEIDSLAKIGNTAEVGAKVSSLISSFTQGGALSEMNADLAAMLIGLGDTAVKVAEVEAQFNATAIATELWNSTVENAASLWSRVKDDAEALKAEGEERLRIAENELSLAQVIAQFGAESAEAEAERDRIARESYELELERQGIYGQQRDDLLAIFDQHNAVTDATAAWADTMAGVRGEIEGILSAIASLGGGMVDRAAKAAELKALNAGATIKDAAAAGQATRREAEFNARSASLGGGLFGRAVAGAQRWFDESGDALEDQLGTARADARKRDRTGRGGGGGSAGLGAISTIKDELARLKPSYEADVAAAEAWRDKALASLAKTKEGYGAFAADVETIFQEKMAKAYEADLRRRDDWAAGAERAQLKLKEDMLSWADVSEDIVTNWAKSGEDAFVSFATRGKAEIGDFVDFAAEQFARLAYQQLIQPGLDTLFNSILSGVTGATGIKLGGAGAGVGAALSTNHTGSPGVMRSYSLAGYGDKMRTNERLTMMRKGEEIMTARALENAGALISAMTALAATSGQPTQVDARPVIMPVNNSSVPLQMDVKETTDSRGRKQYQLALSDAVTTGLRAPGGSARRTLKNEYGMDRVGRPR